jgi:hypothetical protein
MQEELQSKLLLLLLNQHLIMAFMPASQLIMKQLFIEHY